MKIKLSFRWFGENDSIPLEYIRQIPGMQNIVSAIYDVKPGELLPSKRLIALKELCHAHGLRFEVIESLPVHEDIKLGCNDANRLMDIYCENICRCAKEGIKCIVYNFMPVFDWTRTQLDKKADDGSTSLAMYPAQMDYLDPLKDDIRLPGWDSSYSQNQIRNLIYAYSNLGDAGLWRNLEIFLKKIIPVAEAEGVKMALHPDDPPYPVFGLPRIITCEESLDRLLSLSDSPANALCLCTGSLGCVKSNNIVAMINKYAAMERIAFMHIRNIKIMPDNSFEERAHPSFCGSLDMYEIVNALVRNGFDGYVRPDHGRMIWGETGKPGYGLYDRALGASYITGLFEACEKNFQ